MPNLTLNTDKNQNKLNHIQLILSYITLKHIIQIEQDLMFFVFKD